MGVVEAFADEANHDSPLEVGPRLLSFLGAGLGSVRHIGFLVNRWLSKVGVSSLLLVGV